MNSLRDIASNLPFDIAVEALAGLVMDNKVNISVEQLRVRPVAHLHQMSGREILDISQPGFDRQGRELIYFDIGRPSLFDSLPEMLFHTRQKFEDEVDEAEFIAKQRADAREFFLPIEEELYKSRIQVELKERTVLRELNLQMLAIYGLDPDRTPPAFAFFLPFLKRIVGNLDMICSVLEAILNKKVILGSAPSPVYQLPEHLHSYVGSASLGDDFILGETFSDGSRCLGFSICDISLSELEAWIPGGAMRKLLEEMLLPYILPAGENYNVNLLINNTGRGMVLDDDVPSNILGYTTI